MTENSSIQATSGGVNITKLNDVYVDANATTGSVKVQNNDRKLDTESWQDIKNVIIWYPILDKEEVVYKWLEQN